MASLPTVVGVGRRGSVGVASALLGSVPHTVSSSNPDLAPVSPSRSQQRRDLHMMLLNPRAPKIRHLNASHSLFIDMDKDLVQKVQDLEAKVHEMEMQLQLNALVKTHQVLSEVWELEKAEAKTKRGNEAMNAWSVEVERSLQRHKWQ